MVRSDGDEAGPSGDWERRFQKSVAEEQERLARQRTENNVVHSETARKRRILTYTVALATLALALAVLSLTDRLSSASVRWVLILVGVPIAFALESWTLIVAKRHRRG